MTVVTRQVPYIDEDAHLTGLLAWDDAHGGQRPGLLLIHGGAGLDDHAKGQAGRYARLGYSVFACDMLGGGVTGDRERTMAALTAFRDDPDSLARRAQAGLTVRSNARRPLSEPR